MIDVVTTNKTDFFREPNHFHYLVKQVLPEFMNSGNIHNKNLKVWSAGCSTGEEPYTIAMVLKDFGMRNPGFDFSILATDLSFHVLKEARLGIYNENDVNPVSLDMKKKYLLKSKKRDERLVRIVPALRSRVEFRQLNFMDEDYGIRMSRDIIFCRNVIIYFSRSTQEIVLNRICRYLKTGGYLFLGHSETLNGLNVPLVQVAPNIYKKNNLFKLNYNIRQTQ
jgi:chemotaxis protein methyltransferase CheR